MMAVVSRHPRKVTQAKHIPDESFLRVVASKEPNWAGIWDLTWAMPAVPPAVIYAKANRLLDRELITGCGCGCRGDWELTDAGREVLARG